MRKPSARQAWRLVTATPRKETSTSKYLSFSYCCHTHFATSCRLTINIQAAVHILKRPNEYGCSDAATYGSHPAEALCAGRGAQLLRIPQKPSVSFAKPTNTTTASDGSGWAACRRQELKIKPLTRLFFAA